MAAATVGSLVRAALDDAALLPQRVPSWALVAVHSISSAAAAKDFSSFWLVSWLIGFLAGFGGGVVSALLLQNPQAASIGLFSNNEIGIIYTLCWWALHYFPGGWVDRLHSLPPVYILAKAARTTLRSNMIVQRVNATVKLYPGVVAAPIIIGTLAGAGGKLTIDAFAHCAGYRQGRNELSHPGFVLRSAVVAATLQYVLVHVVGVLTSRQGLGLVTSLLVAHSVAQDLMRSPLDWTAPLGRLFHKVTLIPDPDSISDPAGVTTAPAGKPSRGAPRAGRGRATAVSSSPVPAAALAAAAASDAEATPVSRRTTRRRAAAAATSAKKE